MGFFKRLIDALTLGSDKPIQRLLAYYLFLGVVVTAIWYFVPALGELLKGGSFSGFHEATNLLEDGLKETAGKADTTPLSSGLELVVTTIIVMLSTLAL